MTVSADYAQFNRERSFKTTHCTAGPPGWVAAPYRRSHTFPGKPRRLEPIMPLQLLHPAAAAACDALSPCSRFTQIFRVYLDTYYTAAIWVAALPRFPPPPPVSTPSDSTPIMVWQLINSTTQNLQWKTESTRFTKLEKGNPKIYHENSTQLYFIVYI